jgi:hypothetical protein
MMGYIWSEHFTQMPLAEAYVDPHKMTYRARREPQAYIPEGIVWRIVASSQRAPQLRTARSASFRPQKNL